MENRLKLKVNAEKSAVAHPWERKFPGYSMTFHKQPRLKVAPAVVDRVKSKLREIFRAARGRNIRKVIDELTPVLRGWVNYFRLTEVKGIFEELDGWIRRKFRCIIWRQWKRTYTWAKNLMKQGLGEERAWRSAKNQRGPWWNSGASHMDQCFPKSFFDRLGLVSLQHQLRKLQYAS
jgi:RNA-directed DNA polymerase